MGAGFLVGSLEGRRPKPFELLSVASGVSVMLCVHLPRDLANAPTYPILLPARGEETFTEVPPAGEGTPTFSRRRALGGLVGTEEGVRGPEENLEFMIAREVFTSTCLYHQGFVGRRNQSPASRRWCGRAVYLPERFDPWSFSYASHATC